MIQRLLKRSAVAAMSDNNHLILYILDADSAVREALQRLGASVGLTVWASAHWAAFQDAYQPQTPSCLLLDLQTPGVVATNIRHSLLIHGIDLPVIVTAYASDVATAVTAMKQGAIDFLEKPLNEQLLLDSVHQALAIDRGRRRTRAWRQTLISYYQTLTRREQDILQLVTAGLSNREIADHLSLSHKTVEVHRAKVMQKMGAYTLSQLIHMAMDLGILKRYGAEEAAE